MLVWQHSLVTVAALYIFVSTEADTWSIRIAHVVSKKANADSRCPSCGWSSQSTSNLDSRNRAKVPVLGDMDWEWGDFGSPSLVTHWRLYVSAVFCVLISAGVWHAMFPNVLMPMKVWCILTTGGGFGVLTGYIWQLYTRDRRADSPGCFCVVVSVGFTAFGTLSILLLGPELLSQERELARVRDLGSVQIAEIRVSGISRGSQTISHAASLKEFGVLAESAVLFDPNHQGWSESFQVSVFSTSGSVVSYEAGIPDRYPRDVSLRFKGASYWSYLRIPNGALWLNASRE